MYEKLMDEGHDARLLRFSPTADFQGGHRQEQINYRTVTYINIAHIKIIY